VPLALCGTARGLSALEKFRGLAEVFFWKICKMLEPKPEKTLVVSHWAKLFEGFQMQPTELYSLVEERVRARKVPDVQTSRVDWHEGGAFSDKREYLRLNRRDLDFYICAAPFGSGFFVSSRLTTPASINWLLIIPAGIVGFLFVAFIFVKIFGFFGILLSLGAAIAGIVYLVNANKLTFYKIDTAMMFQQAVHQSVMEAVDQSTSAKGIAPLSEAERKPVMHELFR
jgi:hypothetical protein